MISEANRAALEAAGLSFILGDRIPHVPYVVDQWRKDHPGKEIEDRQIFTQPWLPGVSGRRRPQATYYQYKHDRARRTLRGIDEQIAKAERAVAGKTAIKRNRFVKLDNTDKSVNRELEAKARALAGFKAYTTNRTDLPAEQVIGAYHQRWRIEQSFRMSKSDLAARPIFHHTRDSIEAHLTIVFAALAITRVIEAASGWSIKKFVTTARRCRSIEINAGGHTITAAAPIPNDLAEAITAIRGTH